MTQNSGGQYAYHPWDWHIHIPNLVGGWTTYLKKNMLVKLDHETPNFRDSFSNRKKNVKFHHHSHVILTIQKINEFTLIKANLPILPWLFCGGYGGTPNQRPAGNSACSKDWLKASPLVELEEALEEDELGWWQVGWIFFQGNWEVRWLVEFWKACTNKFGGNWWFFVLLT